MNQDTDWRAKEQRELFCKAVNSFMMTNPKLELSKALEDAQKVVQKAFLLFPDFGLPVESQIDIDKADHDAQIDMEQSVEDLEE